MVATNALVHVDGVLAGDNVLDGGALAAGLLLGRHLDRRVPRAEFAGWSEEACREELAMRNLNLSRRVEQENLSLTRAIFRRWAVGLTNQ